MAGVAKHQRSPGSVILVPRRHCVSLGDFSRAEALDLHALTRQVTGAIERAYDPDALYVWQGGRIPLPHIHLRICPRYRDVPYPYVSNSELPATPPEELAEIAARLISAQKAG